MQFIPGAEYHTKGQIVQISEVVAVALPLASNQAGGNGDIECEIDRQDMREVRSKAADVRLAEILPASHDLLEPLLSHHAECQAQHKNSLLFRAVDDIVGEVPDFFKGARASSLLPYFGEADFHRVQIYGI